MGNREPTDPEPNLDKKERDWNHCGGCGCGLNPVQAMLSATHGKCGKCTDKEVEKLK